MYIIQEIIRIFYFEKELIFEKYIGIDVNSYIEDLKKEFNFSQMNMNV